MKETCRSSNRFLQVNSENWIFVEITKNSHQSAVFALHLRNPRFLQRISPECAICFKLKQWGGNGKSSNKIYLYARWSTTITRLQRSILHWSFFSLSAFLAILLHSPRNSGVDLPFLPQIDGLFSLISSSLLFRTVWTSTHSISTDCLISHPSFTFLASAAFLGSGDYALTSAMQSSKPTMADSRIWSPNSQFLLSIPIGSYHVFTENSAVNDHAQSEDISFQFLRTT
jgi:hypothetical protein